MNHLFFEGGGISPVNPLAIPSLFHFFKSGLDTDPDPGSIITPTGIGSQYKLKRFKR